MKFLDKIIQRWYTMFNSYVDGRIKVFAAHRLK